MIERSLLRGAYTKAVAQMEHRGIPIDVPAFEILDRHWDQIVLQVIQRVDASYGIYDGTTFKHDRFERYVRDRGWGWPVTDTGWLKTDLDTFRDKSNLHPELGPLYELRVMLGQLSTLKLAIGADGRNRTMLSPFSSKTSRNQPSSTKCAFGVSRWIRGLVRPHPGNGLAYVDWAQQEFGIAAALSGDPAMKTAYLSTDPYLAFAQQAGEAPDHATKETHSEVRAQYKQCALAVQYGMGVDSLAANIGQPVSRARELLRLHRRTYRQFWEWSDTVVEYALSGGAVRTVFGWCHHPTRRPNTRSLGNYTMQSNGAEMLRVACIYLLDAGVDVCWPVHDALLIEAPIEELDDAIVVTQRLMRHASEVVLDGFPLRTDVHVVRYPDRYMDEKRGAAMWDIVWDIVGVDPNTLNTPVQTNKEANSGLRS